VKFYAFCKFFEKNDYENLTSVGYSEQLEDWLRVTINIIDNANINTIDSMVGCMRLIDELSDNTNDILQYLNTAPKLKSSFAKDQTDEEIEKAKRILNPNSVKCPKEFFNWKEAIKATENYAFFHGSIRFLYTNEYGNVNWNDFGTKWENAKRYFGSQKRDNAEILRLFISNCSKWAKLQEITYDERDATWKVNLTNKELFNVTHNFLMNSVPNLTTFMSKFSSKLAETQGAAHEDLVKTKLLANLRYNRNNVDGCKLRDNIHDLIALFPSGATSEQKKYVIGHYRNEYLNELLKNHGITTQQKVGNCDFFWGWDIYFEYSGKKFLWDTKDDIYLIDEKGNKINSNNPFKINVGINKVIFIKELEKLIIEKNRGY
jgi:hypothetical protein